LTIVSCEKGDIRQSPDGLYIYSADGRREVAIGKEESGRDWAIRELCDFVVNGRPPLHSGRWGKANLEVCLAVLESARTRREIMLSHQIAVAD
jgi:phthalate 4,5-cis-dihydrodiol dehydrogenase